MSPGSSILFGLQFALDKLLSIPEIGGSSLSLSPIGMFIAFCYIWLPYMIVPIQTALERVPKSLLEASSDLGANAAQTFRNVILPLSFPGVIAGSIFTFSLTLGRFYRSTICLEIPASSLGRPSILIKAQQGIFRSQPLSRWDPSSS